MEFRDWFIMGLVTGIAGVASAYLFLHPGAEIFVTWTGAMAAIYGVFHWFFLRDSKQPDAYKDSKNVDPG